MTNDEIVLMALKYLIIDYPRACKEIEVPEQDFLTALKKAVRKYEGLVNKQATSDGIRRQQEKIEGSSIPAQQEARDRDESREGSFNRFLDGIV